MSLWRKWPPFANEVFICIFMNKRFCILIRIFEYVPKHPINNKSVLVLVMAISWTNARTVDAALGEMTWVIEIWVCEYIYFPCYMHVFPHIQCKWGSKLCFSFPIIWVIDLHFTFLKVSTISSENVEIVFRITYLNCVCSHCNSTLSVKSTLYIIHSQ